jgi:hypothetical protein
MTTQQQVEQIKLFAETIIQSHKCAIDFLEADGPTHEFTKTCVAICGAEPGAMHPSVFRQMWNSSMEILDHLEKHFPITRISEKCQVIERTHAIQFKYTKPQRKAVKNKK